MRSRPLGVPVQQQPAEGVPVPELDDYSVHGDPVLFEGNAIARQFEVTDLRSSPDSKVGDDEGATFYKQRLRVSNACTAKGTAIMPNTAD